MLFPGSLLRTYIKSVPQTALCQAALELVQKEFTAPQPKGREDSEDQNL